MTSVFKSSSHISATLPRVDPQQTRTARLAGALYLLMGLPGVFYLQYVPRALVVRGDASATAERMLSSEPLFRLGLAAELMSNLIFILTPLVLYQLFKGVDQRKAALMVIFVLVSIPISLVIVVFETAAFTVLTGPDYLSVFAPGQREALALLLVGLHARALDIAEIFWGLWLIPLGLLVYESGFAPRAIGVLLIAAGIAYVATAFTSVLVPQFSGTVALLALVPEGLGEISFLVWLFAARTRASTVTSPTVASS
jgi:hypothetical protein